MKKPVILFKNIYLKEAKELQASMGNPLMTNSEHFLEQQRSLGSGHSELFFRT